MPNQIPGSPVFPPMDKGEPSPIAKTIAEKVTLLGQISPEEQQSQHDFFEAIKNGLDQSLKEVYDQQKKQLISSVVLQILFNLTPKDLSGVSVELIEQMKKELNGTIAKFIVINEGLKFDRNIKSKSIKELQKEVQDIVRNKFGG